MNLPPLVSFLVPGNHNYDSFACGSLVSLCFYCSSEVDLSSKWCGTSKSFNVLTLYEMILPLVNMLGNHIIWEKNVVQKKKGREEEKTLKASLGQGDSSIRLA